MIMVATVITEHTADMMDMANMEVDMMDMEDTTVMEDMVWFC